MRGVSKVIIGLVSAIGLLVGVAAPSGAAYNNWPPNPVDYANWWYGTCNWDSALQQNNNGQNIGWASLEYLGGCGNPSTEVFCIAAIYADNLLGGWYYTASSCRNASTPTVINGIINAYIPTDANPYRYQTVGRRILFKAPDGQYRCIADNVFTGLAWVDCPNPPWA